MKKRGLLSFADFAAEFFKYHEAKGSLTFTEKRNQGYIREIINHTDIKLLYN